MDAVQEARRARRGRAPSTTWSRALPDSVVAKPLDGRAREPRAGEPAPAAAAARSRQACRCRGRRCRRRSAPQLATLASGAPPRGDWIFEIKFDGYRLMARIEARQGAADHAQRPRLVGEDAGAGRRRCEALGLQAPGSTARSSCSGQAGLPDFNALQNAFDGSAHARHRLLRVRPAVLRGPRPARARRCAQRRAAARSSCSTSTRSEHLRFSADFDADAGDRCSTRRAQHGARGLIAKRDDAPYVSRRTETWLKLKMQPRQEFVIAGYTDRASARGRGRQPAARRARRPGRSWCYAGNVGTGWNAQDRGAT